MLTKEETFDKIRGYYEQAVPYEFWNGFGEDAWHRFTEIAETMAALLYCCNEIHEGNTDEAGYKHYAISQMCVIPAAKGYCDVLLKGPASETSALKIKEFLKLFLDMADGIDNASYSLVADNGTPVTLEAVKTETGYIQRSVMPISAKKSILKRLRRFKSCPCVDAIIKDIETKNEILIRFY